MLCLRVAKRLERSYLVHWHCPRRGNELIQMIQSLLASLDDVEAFLFLLPECAGHQMLRQRLKQYTGSFDKRLHQGNSTSRIHTVMVAAREWR